MNSGPATAVHADSVLSLFPTRPRLLALGEPTHGEDALLDLRNGLFRQLVEQKGYRAIAIESDCMTGLLVDDYVTSGTGTLDDVMDRGFSHGGGESAANRELVRWMRAHNEVRSPSERVRFYGFDGPLEMMSAASPRQALTALHAYLAEWVDAEQLPCTRGLLDQLLGADEPWTNPDAMMDPSQSVGQTPRAGRLRLLADDLAALLDAHTPTLIAASSRDDWDRARLYARTATGLLRYHSRMADSSPSRVEGTLGIRDTMMAAHLLALAERSPTLVFAHNTHLQRDRASMHLGNLFLEWWGAGAIVNAHVGDDYAFLAMALGTIRHHGVPTPPPGTIEGMLYTLHDDPCVAGLADCPPSSVTPPLLPARRSGSATHRSIRPVWPPRTGSSSSETSCRPRRTGDQEPLTRALALYILVVTLASWVPGSG